MDGNGRWAKARGLPRTAGHRKGVEAVRRTVRFAGERGLGYLTLYSFSRENWKRPAAEVSELMALLRAYIDSDLEEIAGNNVRIRVIGERRGLSQGLLDLLARAESRTAANTGMTLGVAFNYSGRNEIARAVRRLASAVAAGTVDLELEASDDDLLARYLDTDGIPDPDLVIRTSGEQRLSNFLLWQSAYAEFAFPSVLWPDFDEAAFETALADYHGRTRRFGMVTDGRTVRAL
jgi:undecaprenyl diphosphate synthase